MPWKNSTEASNPSSDSPARTADLCSANRFLHRRSNMNHERPLPSTSPNRRSRNTICSGRPDQLPRLTPGLRDRVLLQIAIRSFGMVASLIESTSSMASVVAACLTGVAWSGIAAGPVRPASQRRQHDCREDTGEPAGSRPRQYPNSSRWNESLKMPPLNCRNGCRRKAASSGRPFPAAPVDPRNAPIGPDDRETPESTQRVVRPAAVTCNWTVPHWLNNQRTKTQRPSVSTELRKLSGDETHIPCKKRTAHADPLSNRKRK
jgi:hypothetical protein